MSWLVVHNSTSVIFATSAAALDVLNFFNIKVCLCNFSVIIETVMYLPSPTVPNMVSFSVQK